MLNPAKSLLFSPDIATRDYAYLVIASIFFALIPVVWWSLDLSIAQAFFSIGGTGPSTWPWVKAVNQYIPMVFRTFLLLCTALWIATAMTSRWKHLRLPLAFVVLAGVAGPGLAVNGVVKPLWERARPHQIVDFGGVRQFSQAGAFSEECDNNCSFVSGHAACGFFLSSLCLAFRKRRKLLMLSGALTGAFIGFARMANMDHWLSDVLWAFPVTLLSSWMVWWLLQRLAPLASSQ